MSEPLHGYRDILESIAPEGGRASVELPADWAQGRGIFGGLVVAAALRAMRSLVSADRAPRSVMSSLFAPVVPGRVDIVARRLREGGSTTQLEARLSQQGEERALVVASFAQDRPSAAVVSAAHAPPSPAPDTVVEFPYLPGVTPVFTQHLAFRWTIGQVPFSLATAAEIGGYCRFRADQGLGDEEVILALVDGWPAPALSLLAAPAPASTISWHLGFLARDLTAVSDGWWFFHARTLGAASGRAHTLATLWSPAGHAVAVSQQLVAIYA